MRALLASLAASLLLPGCGPIDPSYACTTGETWTGGNEESPRMNPGKACIACHDDEGEGPDYVIAGTVYTEAHEPDDCNGSHNVSVEITDANGTVFTANTNSAGNFFLERDEADIVMPYTAAVITADGTTREMVTEQDLGDCNSCHSVEGSEDAPGRIHP